VLFWVARCVRVLPPWVCSFVAVAVVVVAVAAAAAEKRIVCCNVRRSSRGTV